MKLSLHTERWAAKQPFRIAGHVYDAFDSLVAELSKDGAIGRGEALGVDYMGESVDGLSTWD